MVIETKFDLYEKVKIKEIDQPAIIEQVHYISKDERGIIYQLEYWWGGEIKDIRLFENELEKIN